MRQQTSPMEDLTNTDFLKAVSRSHDATSLSEVHKIFYPHTLISTSIVSHKRECLVNIKLKTKLYNGMRFFKMLVSHDF